MDIILLNNLGSQVISKTSSSFLWAWRPCQDGRAEKSIQAENWAYVWYTTGATSVGKEKLRKNVASHTIPNSFQRFILYQSIRDQKKINNINMIFKNLRREDYLGSQVISKTTFPSSEPGGLGYSKINLLLIVPFGCRHLSPKKNKKQKKKQQQ